MKSSEARSSFLDLLFFSLISGRYVFHNKMGNGTSHPEYKRDTIKLEGEVLKLNPLKGKDKSRWLKLTHNQLGYCYAATLPVIIT
jgi:hypothetical protein